VARRPSNSRAAFTAARAVTLLVATVPMAIVSAACSSNQTKCAAPSSGTFSVSLTYAETLPVAVDCPAASSAASACSTPAPTWKATVSLGTRGTFVQASDGGVDPSWTCTAVAPESSSIDGQDRGVPGTACYLLINCNQTLDAGIGSVQLEIFAQASSDVLAIVQDSASSCCVNEYTGTWN
jgi:hypothetical protein